ncbi:MAG: hypothetical protein ACXWP5_05640 [Bdellovibrionota bacterium]
MKRGNLTLGIMALGLTLVSQAHAQGGGFINRGTCQYDQAGSRGRQMGVRNASRIVGAVWARLGQTCDKLDTLAQIISETPLSRPMMGGVFAACFYEGYTDTLYGQIAAAYDRCQVRCFNEGSDIGRISAEGYCAASIAVGGLYDPGFIEQPPLPFCGENLVLGCKSQYIQTATSEIPACYGFTTGGFSQTFENSIRQDCYVPADVPIRDDLLGMGPQSSPLDELAALQ